MVFVYYDEGEINNLFGVTKQFLVLEFSLGIVI